MRLALVAEVTKWHVSLPVPKIGNVSTARSVSRRQNLGWREFDGKNMPGGYPNVHSLYNDADSIVYLANRFNVA